MAWLGFCFGLLLIVISFLFLIRNRKKNRGKDNSDTENKLAGSLGDALEQLD